MGTSSTLWLPHRHSQTRSTAQIVGRGQSWPAHRVMYKFVATTMSLGSSVLFDYHKPSYCYNCGTAFPWTVCSLEAAKELADELETLTQEEKEQLKNSFPDLMKNTPKTTVAETRFQKTDEESWIRSL